MKKVGILFSVLLVAFVCIWVFKSKTPAVRPSTETSNTNDGMWWADEDNLPKADEAWILDPEIPANYIPVPGANELYMVIDDDGKIIKYRQRELQEDGSWLWETVNPDIPDNYESVEGLVDVYKVVDSKGNVSYFKYIRNDDDTFAFIPVDENGNPLDNKQPSGSEIPDNYKRITGNIYAVYNENNVIIGYKERSVDENGNYVWKDCEKPEEPKNEHSSSSNNSSKPDNSHTTSTNPSTSEPDESKPNTSYPEISQPETSNSSSSAPESSDTDISEPNTSDTSSSEPDESHPDESKPNTSYPEFSQPETSDSTSSTPESSDTDTSEPNTSDTSTSEPEVSVPDTSDPENPSSKPENPGTRTEKETIITYEISGGWRITYQTIVTRVYDSDGELVSTKKDGPVEISRTPITDSDNVPDPSLIKNTLKEEFARVSVGLLYSDKLSQDVLVEINAERAAQDIGPLKMDSNSNASMLSKIRAADMATFAHADYDSPLYGSIEDMCKRYNISTPHGVAEIVWKTGSDRSASAIASRLKVMANESLNNGNFTSIGISIVSKGGYYYVNVILL